MKKLKIFVLFTIIIVLTGYFTYEKKVKYDKYSKVIVDNYILNLKNNKIGDTINYKFKIKNISSNPFYIINIKSDKFINFGKTRIKKIIDFNEEIFIYVNFILKHNTIDTKIVIESNYEKGDIELKIIKNE